MDSLPVLVTGVPTRPGGYPGCMSTATNGPSNDRPGPESGRPPGSEHALSASAEPDRGPSADVARGKGIKGTRTGTIWTGLVIGIVVLLLLLVFILQNLDQATLELFAWDFTLPLGVALLFAALAGAAIIALAGAVRILQIRRAAHRQRLLTEQRLLAE